VKPSKFEYHDPRTVDEAITVLAELGDEAKVLAGGQSLVPLLNFRLAYPENLVDVNGIEELDYLRADNGTLRIGAMCRQSKLAASDAVAQGWPLLSEAMTFVAHAQIRNRGTVGGSVAHADPSAELPVAFTVLDTKFHVRSSRGDRMLTPDEFFVTHLTTALEPDELLIEIEVAAPAKGSSFAFVEFARRHGDFALGGAAVNVVVGKKGKCESAAIALLSAAPTPIRASAAEAALVGKVLDESAAKAAGEATTGEVDPTGDIHATAEYRKHLLGVMVRRGVTSAAERAS